MCLCAKRFILMHKRAKNATKKKIFLFGKLTDSKNDLTGCKFCVKFGHSLKRFY